LFDLELRRKRLLGANKPHDPNSLVFLSSQRNGRMNRMWQGKKKPCMGKEGEDEEIAKETCDMMPQDYT
jgi:hypothetical protein